MQFLEGGPDVPEDLVAQHEDGRVVLFCGAGVSVQAGLPGFGGLVNALFERLTIAKTPSDEHQIELKQFDQVLSRLEERSPERFRPAVADLLKAPANPDLGTHQAIVDLATAKDKTIKLVTTNFDCLFELGSPGIVGRCAKAPRLPIAKQPKWNALVHLHGCIDDQEGTDYRNLVLTAADFGIAYLTERWASRFVAELFSRFTVVFVGYSVNDPVMRYLVDAMAAERKTDPSLSAPYALADYVGDHHARETEWRAKGIEPLLYDATHGHSALHTTLREWARIWVGGLTSRMNIIDKFAPSEPRTLSDPEVTQFKWALSEPSGACARQLGKPETRTSLSWVNGLTVLGMFSGQGAINQTHLIGPQATERIVPLDPIRRCLASWLADHLPERQVINWAVAAEGVLHPEFAEIIRIRLSQASGLDDVVRKLWMALSGGIPVYRPSRATEDVLLAERIRTVGWSPQVRIAALDGLRPWIKIRPPFGGFGSDTEASLTMSELVFIECQLASPYAHDLIVEPLRELPEWTTILADLALDFAGLLRRALDLQAALDAATEDHDLGAFYVPSIAGPLREHRVNEWPLLVDLNREAIDTMIAQSDDRRHALMGYWRACPYPTFRRLFIYAAPRV